MSWAERTSEDRDSYDCPPAITQRSRVAWRVGQLCSLHYCIFSWYDSAGECWVKKKKGLSFFWFYYQSFLCQWAHIWQSEVSPLGSCRAWVGTDRNSADTWRAVGWASMFWPWNHHEMKISHHCSCSNSRGLKLWHFARGLHDSLQTTSLNEQRERECFVKRKQKM